MNAGSTSASGWTEYDNTWDSTQSPDSLYLVEITIGDKDIDQHKITVQFLIIVNNVGEFAQDFGATGFEFLVVLIAFSIAIVHRKKRK